MKLSMHTRFGRFALLEIRVYLKLKLAQLARAWDFAPLEIRVYLKHSIKRMDKN